MGEGEHSPRDRHRRRTGPRRRCDGVELRAAPAAEPARAADHVAQGGRAEARRRRRRDRDRDARRPALALPHGHRDRAGVREVADLRIGEQATVMVSVRSARVRPTRRRNLRLVEAAVADTSGPMKAVWFNQAYLAERLQPGHPAAAERQARPLRASGSRRTRSSPAARAGAGAGRAAHDRDRPGPQRHRELSANRLREWAWQALARAPATRSSRCRPSSAPGAGSPASRRRAARRPLPRLAPSRRSAPATGSRSRSSACTRRRSRCAVAPAADSRPGIAVEPPGELVDRWLASLPFEPTAGQRRAFDEIDADLAAGRPMQRLLMGEVGSRQDRGRRSTRCCARSSPATRRR